MHLLMAYIPIPIYRFLQSRSGLRIPSSVVAWPQENREKVWTERRVVRVPAVPLPSMAASRLEGVRAMSQRVFPSSIQPPCRRRISAAGRCGPVREVVAASGDDQFIESLPWRDSSHNNLVALREASQSSSSRAAASGYRQHDQSLPWRLTAVRDSRRSSQQPRPRVSGQS